MNKVILIGRLTQDPQSFTTKSNIPYTRFNLAVKRDSSSDNVDFVPIVAWRQTSTLVTKYLSKGSLISVEGSITISRYQNERGQSVTSYDVTAYNIDFLESKQVSDQRKMAAGKNITDSGMTFAQNTHSNSQTQFHPSYETNVPKEVEQSGTEESEWSIDDLMNN